MTDVSGRATEVCPGQCPVTDALCVCRISHAVNCLCFKASLLKERTIIQLMQEYLIGLHRPTNSIGALEEARLFWASLFN